MEGQRWEEGKKAFLQGLHNGFLTYAPGWGAHFPSVLYD